MQQISKPYVRRQNKQPMPAKKYILRKRFILFAFFWAGLTGFSFTLNALFWHKLFDEKLLLLIGFTICAAFIAAPIASYIENIFTKTRPLTARFAAIYFLLAVVTSGAIYLSSLFYAISFTSDSLGSAFHLTTIKKYLLFSLAHGYAFAASTARLFLPIGVLSLAAGAFFHCIITSKDD